MKDEVADAFAQGLRARGLMASDGQAPFALRLTVPRFDADMIIGRQARITVTMEVLDRAGTAIYADTIDDAESDMKFMQTGIFADINDLKRMCEIVLARAVDTLLDKPAFRAAVGRA